MKWVLAASMLVGVFALLMAGSASATQSGSTYGGSGNWVVSTPTAVQNEVVDVSGTITVSSTFDLMNATIRFVVPTGAINIIAPNGGMTMQPGAMPGVSMITTNNTAYYYTFNIANTTNNVNFQYTTVNQVNNGITLTGGTQTSRIFDHLTVTHANNYGLRLIDSSATLLKAYVSMDFNPVMVKTQTSACGTNQTTNTSFSGTYGTGFYRYFYTYNCYYDYWSAGGTGVSVLRGSPYFDGVEVHTPNINQRIDIAMHGGYIGFYDFRYYYGPSQPCWGQFPYSYTYNYNYSYHYFYPFLSFNGTYAQDASFALFKDVKPPTEDLFIEFHYNLDGTYYYSYDYCGYSANVAYNYPDYVYSYNYITWTTADMIGIKVINGGIGSNFNNLQLNMGRTGLVIISDWGGSATYQQYFLQSYAKFPVPNVYAFWSAETYNINAVQATTRTDFAIRNSVATGAGMRFDRTYNYITPAQPGGAADTVFRGVTTVDNVSATGIIGVALDIRINAQASQTFNKFDYTASVTGSTFQGARALAISMPNLQSVTSNYTASLVVDGNSFRDGNITPPSTTATTGYSYTPIYGGQWNADLYLDVGWHPSTLGGDWYKADAIIRNNVFQNISGSVIGFPYSDYTFPGGSSITFQNNVFRQIRNYQTPMAGGGLTAPLAGDEMIRTMVDSVTFMDNTFDQIQLTFGLIGAWAGESVTYPYYPFALCAYYMQNYGYNYWYYGCSWPSKTPTIVVEHNGFNAITPTVGGPRDASFFALPGHAKLTFNNNTITSSSAVFVNAFMMFYSPTYQFAVADIDARIQGNSIRGQYGAAPFIYEDPFKAGNPVKILNNDYRDSSQPLFQWMWAYYAAMSVSYRPTENLATMLVADNVIKNVTTLANPIFGLTGRATIINNSFENVNGWAIKVDYMTKVPVLSASNRLVNVTNGYWIAPINTGATLQTTTLTNLTILVSGTAIRWENGNLILTAADFGSATTPIIMVNGHADIYSSNIPVLSASVSAGGSVSVYNLVGFSVTWANAVGEDSAIEVASAALVISSSAHKIISSGRADLHGKVPAKMTLVWEQFSFGASYEGHVYAPFEILVSSQGISQLVKLPDLGPGEIPSKFQDYPSFSVLLKDTLVPTISVGTPTGGSTLGSMVIPVEGHSFERGSGLATQRIKLDSGAWIDIPNSGVSTWQLTLMADTEGLHTIFGEVTDNAGNLYQIQVPFFIDVTPPSLEITDPLVDYVNTRDPTYIVQGHVEPASSAVDINGVNVPVLGRGEFATEFTLLDGLNVLFVTAEDSAGNEVTVVRSVYFDQYSPFIQVTAPIDGLKTSRSVIDVYGRAEPGSTVTVNGIPAVASPVDGSFIIRNFVLADLYDQTENLLLIKATDQVGNVAWDNRSVMVDIRAPSITLELDPAVASRIATGQPVSANSIDVKGKTDSADATVTVAGQEVALQGLTFSRVIVLAEGRNTVELTAEDNVGNVRAITLVIFRDTTKPSLTIDKPESKVVLTNQRTLEIRGTTDSQGATVYLEYNNSVGAPVQDALPAVPVGYPMTYRFERLLDLVSDGNIHLVTVRVVDAAGNEATDSIAYTSKVTPPTVSILDMADSVTDTFVWVNGSTDLGITKVRINGQTFDVDGQFFSVRWNLPITNGDYRFHVSVVDAAGNVGTTEDTVHVEVARPGTVAAGAGGVSPELLTGGMLGLLGVAMAVLLVGYSRRKGQQ